MRLCASVQGFTFKRRTGRERFLRSVPDFSRSYPTKHLNRLVLRGDVDLFPKKCGEQKRRKRDNWALFGRTTSSARSVHLSGLLLFSVQMTSGGGFPSDVLSNSAPRFVPTGARSADGSVIRPTADRQRPIERAVDRAETAGPFGGVRTGRREEERKRCRERSTS